MKKHLQLFSFFILFFPLTLFGQQEKPEAKLLIDSFIKAYNSQDYESVFSLFSSEMKKELPLEELNDFLKNLDAGAGKIIQNEFIRYEENVAIYKLTFDQWVSQYSFSINDAKQIHAIFYFAPYQEDIFSGSAVNSLSVIDKLISEDQTKLIFENQNTFQITPNFHWHSSMATT